MAANLEFEKDLDSMWTAMGMKLGMEQFGRLSEHLKCYFVIHRGFRYAVRPRRRWRAGGTFPRRRSPKRQRTGLD